MKLIAYFMTLLLIFSALFACEPTKETAKKEKAHKIEKKMSDEKENEKGTSSNKKKVKPLPDQVILDVPLINQLPELPNGCEVTSLAMMLQDAGIDVDKLSLAEKMKKVPFEENGIHGDPNTAYVGNMYHGDPGYAVYHGPVADLAKEYLGSRIIDLTGSDWQTIEKQLAASHPVWVITNTTFRKLGPEQFETWETPNGKIKVTMHEHSVLVTGYDKTSVYLNDPLTGTKNKKVNKEDFIEAWKQMGSQAISYN